LSYKIFTGKEADEISAGATFGAAAWFSPMEGLTFNPKTGRLMPVFGMDGKPLGYYRGSAGDYRYRADIVTDTSTIEAKIVLEDVMGLARVDYNLDPILFPVRSDKLVFSVDVLGTVSGSAKGARLVEPEFVEGTQARVNFDLWKNSVLIAFEDKALKSAAHDLMRLYERDAAAEISKMRNDQIAEVIHAATHTAAGAGNWNTMTTKPYNDYNPYVDIHTALEALYNTYKQKAEWVAMHPTQYDTFVRNSFVSSPLYASRLVSIPESGASISLPGWPQISIVVDPACTDAEFQIGNRRCGILATGPTESVQFRNELKGYTGYIIRQWLQPKLVNQDAIYEITGI